MQLPVVNVSGEIMKNRFFYFIFNVITPLVIGAVLYYIFSPTTLFVSGIDKQLRINCHIAINLDNVICQLMRFYLLDYLWAYALMNFALILFGDEKRITLSIFIYIIVMELLQIFPALHATFDVCDIGIEIIAKVIYQNLPSKEAIDKVINEHIFPNLGAAYGAKIKAISSRLHIRC